MPLATAFHRSTASMPTRRKHAAGWGWVLLALVLTQWLGVVHASLHPEPPHAAHTHDTWAQPPAQHVNQSLAELLGDLYGVHGSGSDCRLYDQISHGDCVSAAAPVQLPLADPLASTPPLARGHAGATSVWVLARGPPAPH